MLLCIKDMDAGSPEENWEGQLVKVLGVLKQDETRYELECETGDRWSIAFEIINGDDKNFSKTKFINYDALTDKDKFTFKITGRLPE